MNALDLLKQDHQTVKNLFRKANSAGSPEEQQQVFDRIDTALTIHAEIEETVFYPAMEKYDELQAMVEEALQEHQEVTRLLDEIEELQAGSEEFKSSLEQLIGNVEHHVEEEEGQMFPKVSELCDPAMLEDLGQRLESAKGKQHRQAG